MLMNPMNKKHINNPLDTERNTLHLSDDEKRFAIIDTLTVSGGQTITPVVTIRYQYDNHLGSACLELDNTGQIISYEEYHPFGTTSYRSGSTETEVSLKRYKYCGKERDEETGLYYYGMRYYAAWICRFVSVDPLQFKYPELTPFQYASNRPITMIDLDGAEGTLPERISSVLSYKLPQPKISLSSSLKFNISLEHISTKEEISGNQSEQTSNVKFIGNAKKIDVSKYSLNLISQIASEMGKTLQVTSTKRNLDSQINAMYKNIIKYGVEDQLKLYGSRGQKIIQSYVQALKEGKSEKEIKTVMKQTAIEEGFVSTHMSSDYDKLNAIDFGKNQFKNNSEKEKFVKVVNTINEGLEDKYKIKLIVEKSCFHLDIPQPDKKN